MGFYPATSRFSIQLPRILLSRYPVIFYPAIARGFPYNYHVVSFPSTTWVSIQLPCGFLTSFHVIFYPPKTWFSIQLQRGFYPAATCHLGFLCPALFPVGECGVGLGPQEECQNNMSEVRSMTTPPRPHPPPTPMDNGPQLGPV